MIIRRPLVRLPEPSSLDAAIHNELARVTYVLGEVDTAVLYKCIRCQRGIDRSALIDLDSRWQQLWHPLSHDVVIATKRSIYQYDRTSREIEIVLDARYLLRQWLLQRDTPSFIKMLEFIASHALCETTTVRSKSAYLKADASGVRVKFTRSSKLSHQLAAMNNYAAHHVDEHPLLVAIVLMLGLANCHPFLDGNGRTSRVLLNGLLYQKFIIDGYLPLYELFWVTGASWEINMRYVAFTGDWMPAIEYICKLFDASRDASLSNSAKRMVSHDS